MRRKNNRAATYSGPIKIQVVERCYTTDENISITKKLFKNTSFLF